MTDRPRTGLLKCGTIRPDLAAVHGDYPKLFGALLGPHDVELSTYDVEHGELPGGPDECDSWLVSGSASSVYEQLPWIDRTRDLLGDIVAAGRPMVAVCFGHQLLAQALGGEVARSERGWGIGVHRYDVVAPLPRWPGDHAQPSSFSLLASHQDQVVEVPDDVTVLASSDHCPVAAYSLGDRVVAVQAHPEFTVGLTRGLIDARRGAIGEQRSQEATESLTTPVDDDLFAGWFAAILTD